MRIICKLILRMIGWRIAGNTDYPAKCVICVAPHTSNFDLFVGLLVYTAMGRRSYFFIKKDWFFFPMNLIFRWLGGIPVDRSKKTSLTEQVAEEFKKRDKFQIAITPEATRKPNAEWKRGFYFIAVAAEVPIVIASIDYKRKVVDFMDTFYPTGDADKDIETIKSYYTDVTAKHPERFTLY
ncbi:1-acyl-sn-glycerol-3-phosphate acyltransferase [Dysgonomonas sp. 25]|uniref:1-acyl-sn-glycerol-3-phosphate acyltransferase n=1 Tax=Dysgonomonas sp. 25 TaxID=2302933 RepID=UPI0013D6516B|nr:1-acyl-sn-glycerol-3-phosphate acyltransferase [Dysgonomonas sp. 25]NDV67407.1 acyltransferase [Dysgonomonas sp. 25]